MKFVNIHDNFYQIDGNFRITYKHFEAQIKRELQVIRLHLPKLMSFVQKRA